MPTRDNGSVASLPFPRFRVAHIPVKMESEPWPIPAQVGYVLFVG